MEIMDQIMAFLKQEVGGIEAYRFFLAFAIIFLTLLFRAVFHKYLSKLLGRWAEKTKFKFDDLLIHALVPPLNALILLVGLFLTVRAFELPREPLDVHLFVQQAGLVAILLIVIWSAFRLTDLLIEILRPVLMKTDADLVHQLEPILKKSFRTLVLIIGGIMIIQNLGYSVGSLLAGLGIGGLAIALAAQETLANLFGSVVMLTDKPFIVGDWVQFRDVDGNVESIGLRSTRIRTWAKSLVVVPNKLLTSEVIENWSAMPKRRVKMTIGVTYDSPRDKVDALVSGIRRLLAEDEDVHQDFHLVNFTGFGPSSLDIFIYYFTKTTKWAEYLAVRQRINLEIMRLVEELGLSFAFPSRTIYFGDTLHLSGSDHS
jgi:MscS family membrane protein